MSGLPAARPSEVGPAGHTLWSLPGSSLQLLWPGPGAGLFLVFGQSLVRIEHRTADATYTTRREAGRAVAAFIAAGQED